MSERKDGAPRQRTSQPVADRISERLDKTGDCWLWTGAKISAGYGEISVKGKMLLVHRVVWELENGPIPKGLWVSQRCRVRSCVRPDHLVLTINQPKREARPIKERILERTDTAGDCWLWLGGTITAGYGNLLVDGRKKYVHRLMWEAENGPIPDGLTIDHWCHVRNCVNPDHLRLATRKQQSENRGPQRSKTGLRGVHPLPNGGFYARVAHCYLGAFATLAEANAAAVAERHRVMDYSDGR